MNKIFLIQGQYTDLERIIYESLNKKYKVNKFVEKIISTLFDNKYDLISIFNNYNIFKFEKYILEIKFILGNIEKLKNDHKNSKKNNVSFYKLLTLIYNCLNGHSSSLFELDKVFYLNKFQEKYEKIESQNIIPLTKRRFSDLCYKFISILARLNNQEILLIKGIGSFYNPLSSTFILGEPYIFSFMTDYEMSLFFENKINNISEDRFTDIIEELKSKKNNLNIFQFQDDKVHPFIFTRQGLLKKKSFNDEELLLILSDLDIKFNSVDTFLNGLSKNLRENLTSQNKEYSKLIEILLG